MRLLVSSNAAEKGEEGSGEGEREGSGEGGAFVQVLQRTIGSSSSVKVTTTGPSVTSLHELLVRRGEQGDEKVGVMQDERRLS